MQYPRDFTAIVIEPATLILHADHVPQVQVIDAGVVISSCADYVACEFLRNVGR